MPKPSETTTTSKAFPIIAANDAAKALMMLAAPAGERRAFLPAEATAADVKVATTAAREAVILATAALLAGLPCPVAGVTFRAENGDTCNGASALRRASGIDPRAFGRIVSAG